MLKSQKTDSEDFLWSTLGGESSDGEDAQVAFKRIVNKSLDLNIKEKDIYPVYDYFQETRDKNNYVFYAQVKNPQEFRSLEKGSFSWVSFSEISKLPFKGRTKQDVIVLERVINAKWRDDEAIRENAVTQA